MAIPSNTVWEIRTGGNAINGGGYVTGSSGTDYSQQETAELTITDGASSSTTNLNSATGGFTSAMVGNILCISGGTLTSGRYQITAYVDTNNVTLDRALNTGSGSTVKVGGALSAPEDGDAAATYPGYVAGNTIYIASGTYTKTSTRTLTTDGSLSGGIISWIGYPAGGVRADVYIDESDMPIFTTATNSTRIFTLTSVVRNKFKNIKCTNTASTRSAGWTGTGTAAIGLIFDNCVCDGCSSGWAVNTAMHSSLWIKCIARNSTSNGFSLAGNSGHLEYCQSLNNNGAGFEFAGDTVLSFYRCIAHSNVGAGGYGFYDAVTTTDSNTLTIYRNCVAYNNNKDGFAFGWTTGGRRGSSIENCIAYANSGYGFSVFTTGNYAGYSAFLTNLAVGNNASGNFNNFSSGYNTVLLTADPFNIYFSGDMTLNNSAGGGELLRGSGFPGALAHPSGGTTSLSNYIDIGALQSQGSATTNILLNWLME